MRGERPQRPRLDAKARPKILFICQPPRLVTCPIEALRGAVGLIWKTIQVVAMLVSICKTRTFSLVGGETGVDGIRVEERRFANSLQEGWGRSANKKNR